MNVVQLFFFIWMGLSIGCVIFFRYYVKVTHSVIVTDFHFLSFGWFSNPIVIYYVCMLVIGPILLLLILFHEAISFIKGE